MSVTIKQDLVPSSKYGIKCPYPMDAEYITYHNTANDATAQNEINYMKGNNNQVSYHIAVDDKEAIQGILFNRNAWHCGDGGNGTGNRKSIGVEVCYSKSGGSKFEAATKLAHKVIAQLLFERGWGIERVKKHQEWSGKYCPHRILAGDRWGWVLEDIQNELNILKGEKSKPVAKPEPVKVEPTKEDREYEGNSIVDYLKSIGQDTGFGNRSKLAKQYGIANYQGTAAQNLDLLEAMRDNKGHEVVQAPKAVAKGDMKTTSIVAYLKSINVDSSFTNREKLAKQYGISGYKGTAAQNLTLLDKMRGEATQKVVKAVPSYVGKRVEAKVNLNFYDRPTWNKKYKVGECPEGLGFTIVDKIKVDDAYQYKVKNSRGVVFYLTASDKYVVVK
jgi:N-acetylmuramoyl-L-alanine amidase CwlA